MAAKKYENAHNMKNPKDRHPQAYVTWGTDEEKRQAFKDSGKTLDEYRMVERSHAGFRQQFHLVAPNISARPGMGRPDYDYFRPSETVPEKHKEIIHAANTAYKRVGLIRNIIDLMGDFACQGIRLSHPNKKIEKFYKNWFIRVGGKERSERFLNNLYRTGNLVVRRQTAKISSKNANNLYKGSAAPEIDIEFLKTKRKEIPWKYIFLDPATITVVGNELSNFVGQKNYAILLPPGLRKAINSPKGEGEKKIISQLPPELIQAAKTNKPYPLPSENTLVFHYKKDDWQIWADPMIYAILDDVILLEKLKLADTAALDGAISNIRIFKLGNLEHRIAPTPAAAAKLADILENNVGGGTTDLVWGPDIELLESKTSVHQFLGQGKYEPTLNSIYAGLGIPPSLTGLSSAGGGLTNNFMSLKTLIERLEYGRNMLLSFWNNEIAIVQKAMNFKLPANVEFDRMTLSNEDSEKQLLIQLADRNLVSNETLQRKFGDHPDMEKIRISREFKDRDGGKAPDKASPFHDANNDANLRKIALQTGIVTPSEVGLELEERKEGEKNSLEMRAPKPGPEKDGPPGQPGQGRPPNQKDTKPRKQKHVNPRTGAVVKLWAKEAQAKIANFVNPMLLDHYKKKNMRSLSSKQANEAETIRFGVLCNLRAFSNIDEKTVHDALQAPLPPEISATYKDWLSEFSSKMGRQSSLEESRDMQADIYAVYNS